VISSKNTEDGLTIVELIVAIVVGSIIVGGVSLIVGSQVHLSQRGRDLVIANAYAEQKIESLRSAGYLGLTDGTTDVSGELPTELNNPRNGSLVISSPSAGIKKVDLTINYNDQGSSRTYLYTTFVGELGVGQY
jgi:type II secretory pathway pseudopilin PulG